ncbi:MAG TPA: 2-C-methyl-D-erythritol 4-phosphate cytidylyltransferase [Balneolaceae bacterium]|nr:2-C-methyl-D-erythritol 4-phosphate cytidylyltransferase [Balneolaceae bacterium]
MTTKALIIPAAGSGTRLGEQIPKSFIKLSGCPILAHTLRRFLPLKGLVQIIIATSEDFLSEARQILKTEAPESIKTSAIAGGKERQHSIGNALNELLEADLVIIHDAVRPFVKLNHIDACCKAASETGAALLGVPAKNTIKEIDDEHFIRRTPDRESLWQAQTPQVFKKQLIVEAYRQAMNENYIGTDDASLVEKLGQKVKMIKGDPSNFKITYPVDLQLARLLIEEQE